MDQTISFTTVPNPSQWGSKKGSCVAHIRHNATLKVEQIALQLAARLSTTEPRARCFIDSLCNLIKENAAAGYRMELGVFSIGVSLSGTFESANAKYDKERNKLSVFIKPGVSLTKAVAELQPVNVTEEVPMVIHEVCGDAGGVSTVLPGDRIVVNGNNLFIDAANADEGVWLESKKGDKSIKGVVQESNASTIYCSFKGALDSGAYWLAIYARNGRDSSTSPSVVRRKVQVVIP